MKYPGLIAGSILMLMNFLGLILFISPLIYLSIMDLFESLIIPEAEPLSSNWNYILIFFILLEGAYLFGIWHLNIKRRINSISGHFIFLLIHGFTLFPLTFLLTIFPNWNNMGDGQISMGIFYIMFLTNLSFPIQGLIIDLLKKFN